MDLLLKPSSPKAAVKARRSLVLLATAAFILAWALLRENSSIEVRTHVVALVGLGRQLAGAVPSLPSSSSCPAPWAPTEGAVAKRIYIVGERHCGTNAMERLLAKNFNSTAPTAAGITQHKHWMQTPPLAGAPPLRDALVVIMVRNAYDWAHSLHTRCYHCENFQKPEISFESFIKRPWVTRAVPGAAHLLDRDLENGAAPFQGLVHMRRAKICQWLSFALRQGMWVEVVRWEDQLFPHQQLELVRQLSYKYGLRLASGREASYIKQDTKQPKFHPVFEPERKINQSMYLHPEIADDVWSSRVAALGAALDQKFEAALGYAPVADADLDESGGGEDEEGDESAEGETDR